MAKRMWAQYSQRYCSYSCCYLIFFFIYNDRLTNWCSGQNPHIEYICKFLNIYNSILIFIHSILNLKWKHSFNGCLRHKHVCMSVCKHLYRIYMYIVHLFTFVTFSTFLSVFILLFSLTNAFLLLNLFLPFLCFNFISAIDIEQTRTRKYI